MTKAREKAIEVANEACTGGASVTSLAHKVSDVWEPLLRDLLEHHDAMCANIGVCEDAERARNALND